MYPATEIGAGKEWWANRLGVEDVVRALQAAYFWNT
jgi:hypothetical protein